MSLAARLQLSVMMFLQFFIWGGWFVTLGTFLAANFGASGAQTGLAFSTQSWGAIIAPFIIGLIADRYFNAERILGVHAPHRRGADVPDVPRAGLREFYPYVLAYMIAVHADAGAGELDLVPPAHGSRAAVLAHARVGHGRLDRRRARDQLRVRTGIRRRRLRAARCATRS